MKILTRTRKIMTTLQTLNDRRSATLHRLRLLHDEIDHIDRMIGEESQELHREIYNTKIQIINMKQEIIEINKNRLSEKQPKLRNSWFIKLTIFSAVLFVCVNRNPWFRKLFLWLGLKVLKLLRSRSSFFQQDQ